MATKRPSQRDVIGSFLAWFGAGFSECVVRQPEVEFSNNEHKEWVAPHFLRLDIRDHRADDAVHKILVDVMIQVTVVVRFGSNAYRWSVVTQAVVALLDGADVPIIDQTGGGSTLGYLRLREPKSRKLGTDDLKLSTVAVTVDGLAELE